MSPGVDVRFAGWESPVRASLVRVEWRPGDSDTYSVGGQFDEPLGLPNASPRLGLFAPRVRPRGRRARGTRRSGCPFQAARRTPLALEILDRSDGTGQPLYSGPLQGIDDRALATDIASADPTEVAARLGGHPFPGAGAPGAGAGPVGGARLLPGRPSAATGARGRVGDRPCASSEPPPLGSETDGEGGADRDTQPRGRPRQRGPCAKKDLSVSYISFRRTSAPPSSKYRS